MLRSFLARVREVASEPGATARALRTGLCLATPLAVGLLAGSPAAGSYASLGGFVGWYAHREPYRWRARLLLGLALGYAAAVAAGTLAAPSPVAAALVPGAVIGLAAFVCLALDVAPPREYLLGLVCLLATGLPHDPGAWAERSGWALAGSAFAWLLTMSGWLRSRDRPERFALSAGCDRVTRLLDDLHDPDVRREAVRAVRSARHAVLRAGPGREQLRSALLALDELLSVALGLGNRGLEPIPALAGDVRRAGHALRTPGGEREALALLERSASDARPDADLTESAAVAPRVRDQLRAAASHSSLAVPTAARIALAVTVGAAVGQVVHVDSPYWIALTVAAALQGVSRRRAGGRALERGLGTALGAMLAAGLLALSPPVAVTVVLIALAQTVVELVIPVSYAAGCVLITPIPLLLLHVAHPSLTSGPFVLARVLDTAIGCVIALAAIVVLWPRTASRRVADVEVAAFAAFATLLLALTTPGTPADAVRRARGRAQAALVGLRGVVDAALGERLVGRAATPAALGLESSVERLLVLAIGASADAHVLPDADDRRELGAALTAVRGRLAGESPGRPTTVPDVPGMPRTTDDLRRLTAPAA